MTPLVVVAALAFRPMATPPPDSATAARVKALTEVLSHSDAPGRNLPATQAAVAELAAIGAPAVPLLVDTIVKTDAKLAGTIAGHGLMYSLRALDEIGEGAVEPVLSAWTKLGEVDRWKLMRFRGKHDYAAALPFALASLDSRSDDVVGQAVRYLGLYKEVQARVPLLAKLNTAASRVRWGIIDALAAVGGEEVVDALVKLLDRNGWATKREGQDVPDGGLPPWWPDDRPLVIKALSLLKATRAEVALIEILREKGPSLPRPVHHPLFGRAGWYGLRSRATSYHFSA